jgi:hypothetical protein
MKLSNYWTTWTRMEWLLLFITFYFTALVTFQSVQYVKKSKEANYWHQQFLNHHYVP